MQRDKRGALDFAWNRQYRRLCIEEMDSDHSRIIIPSDHHNLYSLQLVSSGTHRKTAFGRIYCRRFLRALQSDMHVRIEVWRLPRLGSNNMLSS